MFVHWAVLHGAGAIVPGPTAAEFTAKVASECAEVGQVDKWALAMSPGTAATTCGQPWTPRAPTFACIAADEWESFEQVWWQAMFCNAFLCAVKDAPRQAGAGEHVQLLTFCAAWLAVAVPEGAEHDERHRRLALPARRACSAFAALLDPEPFARGGQPEDVQWLTARKGDCLACTSATGGVLARQLRKHEGWEKLLQLYHQHAGAEATLGKELGLLLQKTTSLLGKGREAGQPFSQQTDAVYDAFLRCVPAARTQLRPGAADSASRACASLVREEWSALREAPPHNQAARLARLIAVLCAAGDKFGGELHQELVEASAELAGKTAQSALHAALSAPLEGVAQALELRQALRDATNVQKDEELVALARTATMRCLALLATTAARAGGPSAAIDDVLSVVAELGRCQGIFAGEGQQLQAESTRVCDFARRTQAWRRAVGSVAAASEPDLRQSVHTCIAAAAEVASCCAALQQTPHGPNAAAVDAELAKGAGDLAAAADRLLTTGLAAVEAAAGPLEKVAGGAPNGAVWWQSRGKAVHIMTHFSKTLDTVDPTPIESAMGALKQATTARASC